MTRPYATEGLTNHAKRVSAGLVSEGFAVKRAFRPRSHTPCLQIEAERRCAITGELRAIDVVLYPQGEASFVVRRGSKKGKRDVYAWDCGVPCPTMVHALACALAPVWPVPQSPHS